MNYIYYRFHSVGNIYNYNLSDPKFDLIKYWAWCNILLAPVIYHIVDTFFITTNLWIVIALVMVIQAINLIYYELGRALFFATFLLNGLAALSMGKCSVFYAVLSLHHFAAYEDYRRLVLGSW